MLFADFTVHEVGTLVSLLGGMFAFCSGFFYVVRRFTLIEQRVEIMWSNQQTMWAFQLRRGMGEALEKGLLTKNSPIKLTDDARALFSLEFVEDLRKWNREIEVKVGKLLPLKDFTLAIEKQFGLRIVEEICTPKGIREAECLLIAAAIARGQDTIPVAEL